MEKTPTSPGLPVPQCQTQTAGDVCDDFTEQQQSPWMILPPQKWTARLFEPVCQDFKVILLFPWLERHRGPLKRAAKPGLERGLQISLSLWL
jgi:hypothetical protein